MNKKIILIIVVLAVIGCLFYYRKESVLAPQASEVTFPAGGERLVRGKAYRLTWTDGPDPTQIFLIDTSLKDRGISVSISDRVYGIKNQHEYTYTVPITMKPGEYEFQIGAATSKSFLIVSE